MTTTTTNLMDEVRWGRLCREDALPQAVEVILNLNKLIDNLEHRITDKDEELAAAAERVEKLERQVQQLEARL